MQKDKKRIRTRQEEIYEDGKKLAISGYMRTEDDLN